MDNEEELIPDERLDIAAASKPAITIPENPVGRPIAINRGNNVSAPSMIDVPATKNSGFILT